MALNGWITPAARFCMAFFSFIYCLILIPLEQANVGGGSRFLVTIFYPNEQRTSIGFFRCANGKRL